MKRYKGFDIIRLKKHGEIKDNPRPFLLIRCLSSVFSPVVDANVSDENVLKKVLGIELTFREKKRNEVNTTLIKQTEYGLV